MAYFGHNLRFHQWCVLYTSAKIFGRLVENKSLTIHLMKNTTASGGRALIRGLKGACHLFNIYILLNVLMPVLLYIVTNCTVF